MSKSQRLMCCVDILVKSRLLSTGGKLCPVDAFYIVKHLFHWFCYIGGGLSFVRLCVGVWLFLQQNVVFAIFVTEVLTTVMLTQYFLVHTHAPPTWVMQTPYNSPTWVMQTPYNSPTWVMQTPYNSLTWVMQTPYNSSTWVMQTPYNSPTWVMQTPYNSPTWVMQTPYNSPTWVMQTPYNSPTWVMQTPYNSPTHSPYNFPHLISLLTRKRIHKSSIVEQTCYLCVCVLKLRKGAQLNAPFPDMVPKLLSSNLLLSVSLSLPLPLPLPPPPPPSLSLSPQHIMCSHQPSVSFCTIPEHLLREHQFAWSSNHRKVRWFSLVFHPVSKAVFVDIRLVSIVREHLLYRDVACVVENVWEIWEFGIAGKVLRLHDLQCRS